MLPLPGNRILCLLLLAPFVLAACAQPGWQRLVSEGKQALGSDRWELAKEKLSQAVAEAAKFGVSGGELASARLDLASACLGLGEIGQAEKGFQQALQEAESAWGNESIKLIPYMRSLQGSYRRTGKLDKAEALARRMLALQEAALGPASPELIETLNLVIAAACAGNRCADEEELVRRQLELRLRHRGRYDPSVAVSYQMLAELEMKKGRYERAEDSYRQVLEIRRRTAPELVPAIEKLLAEVAEKRHSGRPGGR